MSGEEMCGWVVLKGSPSCVFNNHIKAGPSRTPTLDLYESQYNNQPLRKVHTWAPLSISLYIGSNLRKDYDLCPASGAW